MGGTGLRGPLLRRRITWRSGRLGPPSATAPASMDHRATIVAIVSVVHQAVRAIDRQPAAVLFNARARIDRPRNAIVT